MLKKLFPLTETKIKFLTVLYVNDALNLASICKELNIPSSNAVKTIPLLEPFIEIKNLGKTKLYSLKKENLSYLEPFIERYRLENILGIHVQLIEKIRNIPTVEEVYLFGSYVKGKATENSDLDIIIKTENKKMVEEHISNIQKISQFQIETIYFNDKKFNEVLINKNANFYHILNTKYQRIKVF